MFCKSLAMALCLTARYLQRLTVFRTRACTAAALLLIVCACDVASGQTVERAMRQAQSRRIAVGVSPMSWPPLIQGDIAPAFPPDGYYALTDQTGAVGSLEDALWGVGSTPALYSRYYDEGKVNSFLLGQTGSSSVSAFTTAANSFGPKPTDAITAANVAARLAAALQKLNMLQWEHSSSAGAPYRNSNAIPWLEHRGSTKAIDLCWKLPPPALIDCCTPEGGPGSQIGACTSDARDRGEAALAAAPWVVSDWLPGFGRIPATNAFVAGTDCTQLTTTRSDCVDAQGTPQSAFLFAQGGVARMEHRADLSQFCGDLHVYIRLTGNGDFGGTQTGTNTYEWKVLPGGSVQTWSGEQTATTSASMTDELMLYKGCYDRIEDELNELIDSFHNPMGPLDGDLTDDALEELDCPPPAGGPYPVSAAPVSLASGHKIESATDLVVAVRGEDFVFSREYTSDTANTMVSGPAKDGVLIGRGWSSNCFRFLSEVPNQVIKVGGPPMAVQHAFNRDALSGKYYPVRGATQYFESASVTIAGASWPVWRLAEPGQWTKEFVRDGFTPSDPRTALIGMLLREVDPYGNTRIYTYHLSTGAPRIHVIYINGSPGDLICDAQIKFIWHTGASNPARGLLKSLQVRRPVPGDNTSTIERALGYTVVQRVDYTYASTPQVSVHPDVGSELDLVQVTYRELVHGVDVEAAQSPSPEWVKITQYRYHSGSAASGAFGVQGQPHQLKSVLDPEQIEYFAQKWNSSLTTPVSVLTAVEAAAAALLNAGDSQVVAQSTLSPRDLCAKVVGYEGGSSHRVVQEYLLTACACGGAAQGRRQDFTYFQYPIGSGAGRTTKITEHEILNAQGSTRLHRTLYHDMIERNGVPYEVRRVILAPAPDSRAWVWEYKHDASGRIVEEATPSEFDGYTPADAAASPSQPSTSLRPGSVGLVHRYTYQSAATGDPFLASNRLEGLSVRRAGSTTVFDPLFSMSYALPQYRYLVTQVQRVVGSGAPPEVTNFNYEFHAPISGGPSGNIAWMETVEQLESTTQNGPSNVQQSSVVKLFTTRGLLGFSVDAEGRITQYGYADVDNAIETNAYQATGEPSEIHEAVAFSSSSIRAALGAPQLTLPAGSANWGASSPGGAGVQMNPDLWLQILHGDGLGRRLMWRQADNMGTVQYQLVYLAEDPLHPGILYRQQRQMSGFRSVSVAGGTTPESTGSPVTMTWITAAGKTLRTSTYAVKSRETLYSSYLSHPAPQIPVDLLTDATGNRVELSRTTSEIDLSGLVRFTKAWSDIATGQIEQTEYRYDNLGRLVETVAPSGSVTRIESRDVLDRALAIEVGVGAYSSGNYVRTSEYFYDDRSESDGPHQGVGNGNLTWEVHYAGEGPNGGARRTMRRFDHRDRLIGVASDGVPYEVLAYDEQSRVVERAVFSSSLLGSIPDLPLTPSSAGDLARRGVYEKQNYSLRGLPFRSQTAVEPTSANPTWFTTDRWFDRQRRIIALAGPSSPVVKTVYDGAGRVLKQYSTTSRPPNSYSAPLDSNDLLGANKVSSDTVIEQHEYRYQSATAGGAFRHLLHQTATRRRLHDSTALGDLAEQPHIVQYTSRLYDSFGRLAAMVDLGTNDNQNSTTSTNENPDLAGGGPVPLSSSGRYTFTLNREDELNVAGISTEHPHFLHELYTRYFYNERGMIDRVRTLKSDTPVGAGVPAYQTQRLLYDDLGRTVLTIDGYDESNFDLASPFERPFDWGTPHGFRQPVLRWNGTPTNDRNRAVATIFDSAGRVSHQVAYNSTGAAYQITQYEFGTTIGAGSTATNSLVASNDLVARVRYPNGTTGLPGSGSDDQVAFGYNRLGELRGTKNQNETIHQISRDAAGRPIVDAVTAFGSTGQSTGVNNEVERIESSFDPFGRLSAVRSFSPANVVRDAVGFSYTPQWKIGSVVQDIDSDLSPASPAGSPARTVAYEFDAQPLNIDNTGNYLRLTQMGYPDGSPLQIDYQGIDSLISRPTGLKLDVDGITGTESIASYSYLGLASVARLDLNRPKVWLDRTIAIDGSRSTTRYPGWDRYGRLKYQTWNLDITGHDPERNRSTHPPIVAETFAFDPASKMTLKVNAIPGLTAALVAGADTDWAYSYDELDRLTTAIRGRHEGGSTVAPAFPGSRRWDLDSLGNWRSSDTDKSAPGDGDFDDANESASGSFSEDNELQAQDGTTYTYDHAGNRLSETKGDVTKHYQYDAWNRLVKVWHVDTGTTIDIARYKYNGLHWRKEKIANVAFPAAASTGLTQRREMYYSTDWQLLEERIDDDWPGEAGTSTIDRVAQQVWGLRGIDDPILRREDRPYTATPGQSEPPARDADGEFDRTWYYLADPQGSVIALVDDEAPQPVPGAPVMRIINRTSYEPYGQARFHARADQNRSGGMSVQDLFDFLNTYFAAELAADHNFSGEDPSTNTTGVTVQDIFDFMTDYFADSDDTPQLASLCRPYRVLSADFENKDWRYPDSVVGYCGYLLNPETGHYCVRNRVYDPASGRWLQRDPAGYVDGLNLYQYVGSLPLATTDPMGLHPEIDAALDYQQRYQQGVLEDAIAGRISGSDAARLINLAGETALNRITLAETISNRTDVKINAGLKAGANATIDTVAGLVTLGTYTDVGAFHVNEYERGAGYGAAYATSRISQEIGSAIVTGKLAAGPGAIGKGAFGLDMAGNIVGTGRGLYGIWEDGITWSSATEALGGSLGFAGGLRAFRFASRCDGLSDAGRTRVLLDDSMNAIGEWRPGSPNIRINRAAVREAASASGRTARQELHITAYHEAFHRAIYPIDRLASKLSGVDDIYSASRAALQAGVGRGRWFRFEERAAETWGTFRAFLRDKWGIK